MADRNGLDALLDSRFDEQDITRIIDGVLTGRISYDTNVGEPHYVSSYRSWHERGDSPAVRR